MKQSCDYCRHLSHDDGIDLCDTIHHMYCDDDLNPVCDAFERIKTNPKKKQS